MKKFVSLFLALALILSLSATAFATTLTIADDPAVERTYNGYKLLDLTVSLKAVPHPDGCDGTNHKDSCYNYAYSVNEQYKDVLQELAGENTDILDFLSNLEGGDEGGEGTLRDAAEEIYDKIKNMTPDADNLNGSGDEIAQGYWLFADVTNLDGANEANSLVVVDTKGQNSLTITPKTDLPTVEKKVKDINDSDSTDTTNNKWMDSADHDITDTVEFKLTATLPSNVENYDEYMIRFHDTLSSGLTLDSTSFHVETAAGADVTGNFTYDAGENGAFTLTCNNVLDIEGVTKDTVFVVTYRATLNENAVIGAAGNPNKVYLEFSNNPYDEGTGKTKEDTVIVFTYKLTINKTDADGAALKGAGFILYKKNSEGEYVQIGDELKGNDMTTFTWKGLDDGEYKLVENTVPDGYNKMEDIEFTITAEHDEESDNPTLTSLDGGNMGSGDVSTGTITKDVVNLTGTVLPETGARGTFLLITCSSMFVMVAAVFMVTRKKMSIYED